MKEKLKEKRNEKIRKILKSPIMLIIIFSIITVVLSLGTSYAANVYLYDSKDVSYDNTRSGITSTDVQGAVDELYFHATDYTSMDTRVTTIETTFLNKTYPVGSIYISVTNTNPGTLFGGTWVSFGEGRTLIGVGTGIDSNSESKTFSVNSTGGEYDHTLVNNELPKLSGTLRFHGGPNGKYSLYQSDGVFSVSGQVSGYAYGSVYNANNSYEYAKFNIGGDESHNNIQPYITVYMWKRTA